MFKNDNTLTMIPLWKWENKQQQLGFHSPRTRRRPWVEVDVAPRRLRHETSINGGSLDLNTCAGCSLTLIDTVMDAVWFHPARVSTFTTLWILVSPSLFSQDELRDDCFLSVTFTESWQGIQMKASLSWGFPFKMGDIVVVVVVVVESICSCNKRKKVRQECSCTSTRIWRKDLLLSKKGHKIDILIF